MPRPVWPGHRTPFNRQFSERSQHPAAQHPSVQQSRSQSHPEASHKQTLQPQSAPQQQASKWDCGAAETVKAAIKARIDLSNMEFLLSSEGKRNHNGDGIRPQRADDF
jgi:hypothetical protein